ncbi:MAG: D-alanyl-D-alanine carboxypeptidase/D-alanyl-D-alanine-endopeptidase, partial [Mobilicoccus sp.]|nr:D-alanyl-D-alanine carboxypeptidase/D-alanyl-D-alanine-endopeptidase [Mobilicoccus sp.]
TTSTRAWPYDPAPRDPAITTTSAFAAALVAEGIHVRGRPERAEAPEGSPTLASVESAPLVDVLAEALRESDNALTESLARSAAAQRVTPGPDGIDTQQAALWVRDRLGALDIPIENVTLLDTSGLSRGTLVPTSTVADVLALTIDDASFTDVVARLPVAALSGTLHDRFVGDAAAGAGRARAKTGTLTGVHALAGTVVDADGRLLLYSVLADEAGGTLEARAALDRLVAALAACGCR